MEKRRRVGEGWAAPELKNESFEEYYREQVCALPLHLNSSNIGSRWGLDGRLRSVAESCRGGSWCREHQHQQQEQEQQEQAAGRDEPAAGLAGPRLPSCCPKLTLSLSWPLALWRERERERGG